MATSKAKAREAPAEVPTVRLNGLPFRLPFAGLFRPHSDSERIALVDSIRRHRVTVRVITYDSLKYGKRCVIDGATRLSIAAELGLWAVPVHHRGDLTDDEARELAVSLNADRRHLTPEEQAAARAKRNAEIIQSAETGDSLRTLADRYGLNHSTIDKILQAAGFDRSEVRKRVKGRDGKSYAAAGKKRVRPPVSPLELARRSADALREALDQVLAGELAPRLRHLLDRHQAEPSNPPLAFLAAALNDLAAEVIQS